MSRPGPGGAATDRYAWGANPLLELLRARPQDVERVFVAQGVRTAGPAGEVVARARKAGIQVDHVPRERLDRMAQGGAHQGLVAEVRHFDYAPLELLVERAKAQGRLALLVVLDGVQDPHNLGAIIRSAHGFGAQGVIVPKDRAANVTGAVAKASAGALAHCPVARVTNLSRTLEALRDEGFWSVVLAPDGGSPIFDLKLDGPLVLVVGAEGEGVRDLVASKCDFRASIPMGGKVGSFNASVSAGVALYEIVRQRQQAPQR